MFYRSPVIQFQSKHNLRRHKQSHYYVYILDRVANVRSTYVETEKCLKYQNKISVSFTCLINLCNKQLYPNYEKFGMNCHQKKNEQAKIIV